MQMNGTEPNSPSDWQTAPTTRTESITPLQSPAPRKDADRGTVTVADRVVAEIVGRSVGEVVGVAALVPPARDPLLAWLRRMAGRDTGIPGVQVAVGRGEVVITLTIIVAYGASIPQVVDSLRRYVTARVETLTGLAVRDIRIEVAGLTDPDAVAAADRDDPE